MKIQNPSAKWSRVVTDVAADWLRHYGPIDGYKRALWLRKRSTANAAADVSKELARVECRNGTNALDDRQFVDRLLESCFHASNWLAQNDPGRNFQREAHRRRERLTRVVRTVVQGKTAVVRAEAATELWKVRNPGVWADFGRIAGLRVEGPGRVILLETALAIELVIYFRFWTASGKLPRNEGVPVPGKGIGKPCYRAVAALVSLALSRQTTADQVKSDVTSVLRRRAIYLGHW